MVIYEKTGAMLVGVFVGLAIWVGWAGFEAYKIVVGSQARPALRAIHAKLERSGNDGLYGCLFDRTCREQSVDGFGDYPWYVGLGAGFVILGLVAGSIIGEETTVKAPAGASFAVEENLKPFIAGKYGYLGVIPSGKMLSWIKDLLYNMVVTGNPGAGKSSRCLKPLIIKAAFDGLSSVIWDMKPGDLDGGFEDRVGVGRLGDLQRAGPAMPGIAAALQALGFLEVG